MAGFFDEIGNFLTDAGRNLANGAAWTGGAPINPTHLTSPRRTQAPLISAGNVSGRRTQQQARDRHQFLSERAGKAPDPMADLLAFVNAQGGMVGGSGGSPGNGAAISALISQINKNKDAAAARYQTNKAQITDMYGQLRDQLAPNAGLTAARYNSAIDQAKTGGKAIADTAVAHQDAQNAQRDAALNSLGIDPTVAVSEENAATDKGLAQLAENNASWANLQAVLSNAQQARDQLDAQGATDAGILANRQLTGNYEDYLRSLDQQIAEARSSFTPGSGGTPAHYSNPLLDTMNDAILQKMLIDAGIKSDPNQRNAPNFGNPAAYLAALGDGLNPDTQRALSTPEILARIAQSADPMGALMARKAFG